MMTIKTPVQSETPLHQPHDLGPSGRSSKAKGWFKQSWRLLALPLLLFISIPLLALFQRTSLADFISTLNQFQVIQAINLSIVTSLATVIMTLAAGTPVAYLLAQRRFRFYRFVDTIIDLPTVLPPSVAGVALLMAFGRMGLFGPLLTVVGINIPFTVVAVVMAQTFIAAPLYVKAATIALLSGIMMTWARALGEFGATIIFAGNFPGRTQTMPLAIYIGFEIDLNVALTLSIIMMCLSFLTLVVVKGILHRQLDANYGFTTISNA